MNRFFLFFLLCSFAAMAQDTIYYRNGEVKLVKIMEVHSSEIKYIRADNLTGPAYYSNKNEINSIRYSNGHIDIFNAILQQANTEATVTPIVKAEPEDPRIIIGPTKRLSFMSRNLGERQLLVVITNFKDKKVGKIMREDYYLMRRHKRAQFTFAFTGLGLGLGSITGANVIASNSGNWYNSYYPLFGFIIGGVFTVTGQIIAAVFKHERFESRRMIVDTYNKHLQ